MRTIQASRVKVDAKSLKFRPASPSDYQTLVTESATVKLGEDLAIVFHVLPSLPPGIEEGVKVVEYIDSSRADGLVNESCAIGALPRVTLRRDYCTRATVQVAHPDEYQSFKNAADVAALALKVADPQHYAKQKAAVDTVLPEWRINEVFTSGIVNKNNSLRYHKDGGNFPGLWSAMFAWSFDIQGGVLSIPEVGLGFSFERPALILFNGADLVHAVTPIVRRSALSHRYSIVFYAMKLLCNCLTSTEELARIRKLKTKREMDRHAGKKTQ